jgi:lipoprotein-anchoring transpeptidase ErfK/SrfK
VVGCVAGIFAQEAQPAAPLIQIPENQSAFLRHNYQQVVGPVTIYNAPGGAAVRTRPEGQFFVSVVSQQGEWTQINAGEWVRTEQLKPAPASLLRGVLLSGDEAARNLGILHHSVYRRDQPGPAYDESSILWEYAPVVIQEVQTVDEVEYVRIDDETWITGQYVRRVRPVARPDGIVSPRWVGVDVAQQVLIAYEGDAPVFATLVSTGLPDSPTTLGIHSTYLRFHERAMSRSHPSQPAFYLMEDVPYTFYFDGDQALHGAYWHDQFGTAQSHGCINLSLNDAAWLYGWLSESFDVTDADAVWPQVYVYDSASEG